MSTRIFPSSIATNSGRLLTEKSVSNIPRYILDYNCVISGGNWDKTVSDSNTIELEADLDSNNNVIAPSVYIFDGYQVIVDDAAITLNINPNGGNFTDTSVTPNVGKQFVVYLRLKYQDAGENSEDFVVNEDFHDDDSSNNPYVILEWPTGDPLLNTVDGSELTTIVAPLTSINVTNDAGYIYKYCPLWVIRYTYDSNTNTSTYVADATDSNDDYRFLTKIAADKVDLGFFELNTLADNDGSDEDNESVYDQRKVISANDTYKTTEQLLYQYIKWINNSILGNKSLSKTYNPYGDDYITWQHSYISSSTTGLIVTEDNSQTETSLSDFPWVTAGGGWGDGDNSDEYSNVGIKNQVNTTTFTSTTVDTNTTTFIITLAAGDKIVENNNLTITIATSGNPTYKAHNNTIYASTDSSYTTPVGTIDYSTGELILNNSILTISGGSVTSTVGITYDYLDYSDTPQEGIYYIYNHSGVKTVYMWDWSRDSNGLSTDSGKYVKTTITVNANNYIVDSKLPLYSDNTETGFAVPFGQSFFDKIRYGIPYFDYAYYNSLTDDNKNTFMSTYLSGNSGEYISGNFGYVNDRISMYDNNGVYTIQGINYGPGWLVTLDNECKISTDFLRVATLGSVAYEDNEPVYTFGIRGVMAYNPFFIDENGDNDYDRTVFDLNINGSNTELRFRGPRAAINYVFADNYDSVSPIDNTWIANTSNDGSLYIETSDNTIMDNDGVNVLSGTYTAGHNLNATITDGTHINISLICPVPSANFIRYNADANKQDNEHEFTINQDLLTTSDVEFKSVTITNGNNSATLGIVADGDDYSLTITDPNNSGHFNGINLGGDMYITGNLYVTGTINSGGNIQETGTGSVYKAVYNDYAEYYVVDGPFEAGDIIAKKPGQVQEYTRATQENAKLVVGVISDTYGSVIGYIDNETNVPVAVAGRVMVKVIGPVTEGELLTVSYISGVAIRASVNQQIGTIIGKALETKDTVGIDRIWMQVMLG